MPQTWRSLTKLALAAFAFPFAALLSGCGLGDDGFACAFSPGSAPVLENLIVAFAPYDPTTGRAGAFVFDRQEDKVFLEFNAVVGGPTGPKTLPTFEYRVDPQADVYAPIEGTVVRFVYQPDTADYEIGFAQKGSACETVSIDHVKAPTVGQGDAVTAGKVVGKPGSWSASLGRVELMVTIGRVAYCPFSYFDPARKSVYQQKVRRLMADWETFKGDPTIYDEAAMVLPGCLGLTGTP